MRTVQAAFVSVALIFTLSPMCLAEEPVDAGTAPAAELSRAVPPGEIPPPNEAPPLDFLSLEPMACMGSGVSAFLGGELSKQLKSTVLVCGDCPNCLSAQSCEGKPPGAACSIGSRAGTCYVIETCGSNCACCGCTW
jgi:hypothetical protein